MSKECHLKQMEQALEKLVKGKTVEQVSAMFDDMLLRMGYHVCPNDSTDEMLVWKDSRGAVKARTGCKSQNPTRTQTAESTVNCMTSEHKLIAIVVISMLSFILAMVYLSRSNFAPGNIERIQSEGLQ